MKAEAGTIPCAEGMIVVEVQSAMPGYHAGFGISIGAGTLGEYFQAAFKTRNHGELVVYADTVGLIDGAGDPAADQEHTDGRDIGGITGLAETAIAGEGHIDQPNRRRGH